MYDSGLRKIVILMLAGFGDCLSFITRLPKIIEKFPDHQIKFYLGGFGKSPLFSKEQLERENNKYGGKISVSIIKDLVYHNQLPQIREFLKKNIVKEGDIFFDASFCEEIFDNKILWFLDYEMQIPYEYSSLSKNEFEENIIAIHPLTQSGNAEGFESDLQKGRFWKRENWKQICINICKIGYIPTFCGYGDEDWGLYEELKSEGYRVSKIGNKPVEWVIDFLKNVKGCIVANSWSWEITSRLQIPTIVFYTKNHFFIKLHCPQNSEFFNTCYIETNNNASVEDIWNKFSYILENKKQPSINYSTCMITLNDQKCIKKSTNNVSNSVLNNKENEFIIVDGGSTDGTIDMLPGGVFENQVPSSLAYKNIKIYFNKWQDDFSQQKNYALSKASSEWRIFLDADEEFETLLWQQISWYLWEAEQKGIDCIRIPRINVIENLNKEELIQYAQKNGWVINGPFQNWVNYPDYQQRIFKSNCKFVGKLHEIISGYNKQSDLVGVHCLHYKTKERQESGLQREHDMYIRRAKEVKQFILEIESEENHE